MLTNGTKVMISGMNDTVDNKIGTIIGLGADLPIVGQLYIVQFEDLISSVYLYAALIIPNCYLVSVKS